MTRELLIECNNYAGITSQERCNMIQEYVKQHIEPHCQLKYVQMIETQVVQNLIQPTIIVIYEEGDHQLLINTIDKILLDIGVTAIKAVVTKITTRALETALAGSGLGLLAGGSTRNGRAALATTVLGAILGGIIGSAIEKRILELVTTKESGNWIIHPIAQRG